MSQTHKTVSKDLLQRIKGDETLILAIAKGTQKKFKTVLRWLKEEDEGKITPLSSDAVTLVIQQYDASLATA